MKTIEIQIHSMVDVITNSSTEIYTYVEDGALEFAQKAIGELIKQLGLPGEVDEYFDIHMWADKNYLWNGYRANKLNTEFNGDRDACSEAFALLYSAHDPILMSYVPDEDDSEDYASRSKTLKITLKKDPSFDLVEKINCLFYQEAYYDG